jgi:tetratricopeptide (TPR) repeat protein
MLADPKHAATYSLRGRSEEASGDDATAYEDYNTALGLDPANFLALMGRGRIYRRKEQYSSAVTDFTAAMEAGKRDEKLSARLERATTYRLVSHLEACGEDIGQVYLQIGKYNPLYAAATIEYGRYYEAMKKYNPAKDMYEKALAVQESAEVRAALNRVVAAENDSRNTRSTSTYTPSYSPPVRRRAPTVTTQRCNACKGEGKIYYEKLAVGGGLSSGGSSTYSTVNQYGTKTYSTSSGTGSVTCTACNGKGTVQVTEGDYDEDY